MNLDHQLLREKLWADVYAVRIAIPDQSIEDAAYYADQALERFDQKFSPEKPQTR